jgi:peptidoglycan/xylan/chitin deacetylase (PgdA/CDA1 family)
MNNSMPLTKASKIAQDRMVILTYHRLYRENQTMAKSDPAEKFYAVPDVSFVRHLQFLQSQNFTSILIEEFLTDRPQVNEKMIILTFDDGNLSDFEIALPLLLKFGFKAVFFICIDFIGRPGYMDWRQIEALAASGMSIQCHGLLHRDYSLLPEKEAEHELLAARRLLERNLNREIRYLALPGGFASFSAYSAGFSAGFQAICNSEQGTAQRKKILRRFVLRRLTSQTDFEGLVNRNWKQVWSSTILQASTSALKSTIGGVRYELIKQRLWR